MSTRHLELLRGLSTQRREKEEQARREEQRLRKREGLLKDRLLRQNSLRAGQPPLPSAPGAAAGVAQSAEDAGDADAGATTALEADIPLERRQRRVRTDRSVESRQSESIHKLQSLRQIERQKSERDQLTGQWKTAKAPSYLLDNCKNPKLKEYLENKTKPSALPRLPNTRSVSMPPAPSRPTDEGEEAPAEAAGTAEMSRTGGSAGSVGSAGSASSSRSRPRSHGPATADEEPADSPKEAAAASPKEAAAASPKEAATALPKEAASASTAAKPPRPPKPAEAGTALLSRLQQGVRQSRVAASCDDTSQWKKRNGFQPESKVFVCCGGYPDFRDALLRRGWLQNPDKDSTHFDLKWCMATQIDHERLQPHQVINHFDRCKDLTTKVGLTLNLRDSSYLTGVDHNEYYPRAFDLSDPAERADFVLSFKFSKAESILWEFLRNVEDQIQTTFSMDVIGMALKICMRLITDPEDVLDCPELAESLSCVTKDEWSVLQQVCLDDPSQTLEVTIKEKELEEMIKKKFPMKPAIKKAVSLKVDENDIKEVERKTKEKKKTKKKKKKEAAEPTPLNGPMSSFENPRGRKFIQQARELLVELGQKSKQHAINGRRNAWIVKPSRKSRGRGIEVMRELDEIFKTTESDGFQWICQKYIEQPHLVHGYKFDIRQWVLVTDWNPLTVYIWRHPYLRFAGQKYDETMADRSNFTHLTNNSIIHDMHGFDQKNEDLQSHGYMWFVEQYKDFLHTTTCKCEKHRTPWLKKPTYTCDYFGVRWEDVAFVAKEESDDEDGPEEPEVRRLNVQANARRPPSSEGSTATPSTASTASSGEPSSPAPSDAAPEASEPQASASRPGSAARPPPQQQPEEEEDESIPVCEDVWESHIRPRMEEIIIQSLLCVVDEVKHRKNTVELYGYDFMISNPAENETPDVWLIEVNSSPACDYSTPVTCPLVKKVMEDTAKVMVDMPQNPETETGEWELMKHGFSKPFSMRTKACSMLEAVGQRIKAPKGWKKANLKKKKKKVKVDGAADEEADEEAGDNEGAGEGDGDGDGEDDENDVDCDGDGDGSDDCDDD
mmetsp:Transcript_44857/g.116172  ORF Transcript_44857/g.116172 Transcript_44857/m.116172 type:complete len:1066 (-) Transcript_44857:223-3420(-)